MNSQVMIRVYVAENWNMRAVVEPVGTGHKYEVTIGGSEWKKGRGEPWQDKILAKCYKMLDCIRGDLNDISEE